MSARDSILLAIAANKPATVPLPVIDTGEVIVYDDVVIQFKEVVESIGAKVVEIVDEKDIHELIEMQRTDGKYVVSVIDETQANLQNFNVGKLAAVDLAIVRGIVAVAENGAIWIDEKQMVNRLLPFICQHLVLVIYKKDIVATMHHAYEKIRIDKYGFGVFIAGPSKTADIEQSLVIGAHGPRSLAIYMVENNNLTE